MITAASTDGGCVVALGKGVGRNVGAGMTGGIGYFLDEDGTFESKVNGEIVAMQRVITPAGEAQLKGLTFAARREDQLSEGLSLSLLTGPTTCPSSGSWFRPPKRTLRRRPTMSRKK